MIITELAIPDSYLVETKKFGDERGVFLESFRLDKLEAITNRSFQVKQVNTSISQKGVLRGIHYAAVPSGQAKYVTVHAGSIIDFIVDIRVGSPNFGQWTSVKLSDVERNAVFISEGLGHAFLSLQDDTVVSYLVSDKYRPTREFGINPLDAAISLELSSEYPFPIVSEKDNQAPRLDYLLSQGLLPNYEACLELYASLKVEGQ